MNRSIAGVLTGFVLLAAFDMPRASAQPQVPAGPARPVFSPYLNLLNGGNPALNYFGLVVPQMQMQQQLSQLQTQQQLTTGNQSGVITGGGGATLYPPTGYVPVFNNTYQYFNRVYIGSGTSGGGVLGTASLSGGSFDRLGSSFSSGGSGGAGSAAGFQRGGPGAGGLKPSFSAPKSPAGPGGQPKQ